MEHKFDSGDQGVIAYKSSNPFEFFHILNSKEQEEQDMFGTLVFPEKKRKKLSFGYMYAWKLRLERPSS